MGGEYIVVDRPNRLVMTWGFESPLSLPSAMSDVPPGSSTVEFTFVADGDDTLVRVRHSELPNKGALEFHSNGWSHYLGRLQVVLGGDDPGDDPFAERGITLPPKVG